MRQRRRRVVSGCANRVSSFAFFEVFFTLCLMNPAQGRRCLHSRPDQGLQGLLGPRQGPRPGRPEPDDPPRRGVRPARAQRLGQEHDDQAAAGPDLPHARRRPSVLGQPAGSTAINEQIGFLPEESYLYQFLNGEETLQFYGKLFKIPRRELKRRVPELLDIVGLDAKAASASFASIPRAWPAASAWPRR